MHSHPDQHNHRAPSDWLDLFRGWEQVEHQLFKVIFATKAAKTRDRDNAVRDVWKGKNDC
jgi:hypothetical protein